MSSCNAVTGRVGVGVGGAMDWVGDADTKEAELLSGPVKETGVGDGGVASGVY